MTGVSDYTFAFLTGFLGSFHCLGMCGGLVSAFFLKHGNNDAKNFGAYHIARISVYVVIGALTALIGMTIEKTGVFGKFQGILQIAAGVTVILIGLDILKLLPFRLPIESLPALPLKLFKRSLRSGPLIGSFMGGMVNGLIPCSLVYAVAIKAMAVGQPLDGALLMAMFGVGTLPSMLSVSFLLGKISGRMRGALYQTAAYVVIAMGCVILYEGYTYFTVMKKLAD